jgi:hypothetical protein
MAKFIKIGAGWNNDIEYMCIDTREALEFKGGMK